VNYNGTTSFTLTPNTGYTPVVGGTCGGSLVGNIYTTNPITANCTVDASFTLNSYSVTPSVSGGNGTISPSTVQTVGFGGTASFTITPNAGYHIVTPVGGTCGGTLVGNSYTTNAVTASCTVVASFAIDTFTVTPSVTGGNGSISPSTPQTVNYNGTTSFTLTPNTGYTPVVGGTCGGSLVGNIYTTNPVTASCTVVASFTQNSYTITTSAGSGGSITPENPTVIHGSNQTFTITPNTGYHIVDVQADGVSLGAVTTYTFTNVTSGHTISATFAINTYSVTPSVTGGNGSISPSTPQTVNHNGTVVFTLTPNAGYHPVMSGTCGGSLAGNTFTTNAVTANCTVVASFAIDTFTVTPSVSGGNGSISPSTPQTVNWNNTTSFTLSPNSGYHIVTPVGGTCGGSLVGNTYTTNAVTANCTVVASFAIDTFTVTPSVSGGNGSISPSTPQTVDWNNTTSFTLTPNSGYHIVTPVGGTCGGSLVGNSYTTNAVTTNCTVVASFAIDTFTLSVTKVGTGNGDVADVNNPGLFTWSVTSGGGTYDSGTSVALVATPDGTSTFTGWGGDCSGTDVCNLTMSGNHNVTVSFDPL
jgi:hypothetical protein